MWANKWCHFVERGNCKFATWKPRREDMNLLSSHIEKKETGCEKKCGNNLRQLCNNTFLDWMRWVFHGGLPRERCGGIYLCFAESTHSSCNTAIWHKMGELFKNNATTRIVTIFNPFIGSWATVFFGNMDSVRFRDKCLTDLFTPFHILHT